MQRIFAILILMLLALGTAAAQEPATSTPTPEMEKGLTVPPIAPDFHPEQKRHGTRPCWCGAGSPTSALVARGAALALENNKDVEVAAQRQNRRV